MFPPLHFSLTITNRFFFSSSSSPLHILSTFQLLSFFFFFFLQKLPPFLPISPSDSSFLHSLWNSLPPYTFSSPPWHPSPRKPLICSQAMLSISLVGVAVRLMEPPLLTYRLENQSSFGKCPSQIGEFSNFSHFWVFLWSFVLIYFWTYKCLSFVVGWV